MIRQNYLDKPEYLIEVFARTIKSFFPKFGKWVNQINDPRFKNMITYDLSVEFWTGIFLYIFKLERTQNIKFKLGKKKKFIKNFKKLSPLLGINQYDLERLPDHGTLKYLTKKLSFKELEKILVEMVKRMIRKRVLESNRLLGKYYLLAVDGTRMVTFPERHCDHCLTRKIGEDKDGNPIYEFYHYILAVTLVTPSGLSLPLLTEFVENSSKWLSKQDCETKAFHRVAKRLKEYFPKTNFCFVFDSLYPGDPIFNLCKKNDWAYIIRFKEGSMPAFYKEYQEYLPYFLDNRGCFSPEKKTTQSFQWINDIEYLKHKIHVLECFEKKKGKKEKTKFTWITNLRINKKNFNDLSNRGGRCRWNIENQGFNTQKNGGYELEHVYCEDYNAMKCFYFFLQIAHFINQLIEKGGLIRNFIKNSGSIKNFTVDFWVAFVTEIIEDDIIKDVLENPCQIRINSS